MVGHRVTIRLNSACYVITELKQSQNPLYDVKIGKKNSVKNNPRVPPWIFSENFISPFATKNAFLGIFGCFV